jgi:hypothetical protein
MWEAHERLAGERGHQLDHGRVRALAPRWSLGALRVVARIVAVASSRSGRAGMIQWANERARVQRSYAANLGQSKC